MQGGLSPPWAGDHARNRRWLLRGGMQIVFWWPAAPLGRCKPHFIISVVTGPKTLRALGRMNAARCLSRELPQIARAHTCNNLRLIVPEIVSLTVDRPFGALPNRFWRPQKAWLLAARSARRERAGGLRAGASLTVRSQLGPCKLA